MAVREASSAAYARAASAAAFSAAHVAAWRASRCPPCSRTPLQLAAKLGDHGMFRWILKKHSQDRLDVGAGLCAEAHDLSEIDSINAGGNDVMELVCAPRRQPRDEVVLERGS